MSKKTGSAVAIVIIIILTISAYVTSAVFSNNNFSIMNSKYDKIIQNIYSENIDNIPAVYDELVKINK